MRSILKKSSKFQRNLLKGQDDQREPLLDQLLLTMDEQRGFDSFASPNTRPKGKTPLWKVSQEKSLGLSLNTTSTINFCDLKRTDSKDTTKVLGMSNPPYHAPVRAPINLALPWHASSVEIAERNHDIHW